ncbi:MAG: bifunctional nuclease family protein [Planctomycetes bacterium]|nr:bifunctional nuclease family protein [Planctomycetota bacterium]
MDLVRIVISEESDQQVIVLAESDGKRRALPIVIGIFEAAAIDRKVKNIRAPRPMTHDLIINVIAGLGGRLASVVINELKRGTFFARLLVERAGEIVEIDSRPSDAIALSVQESVPIFAARSVLDEAAVG